MSKSYFGDPEDVEEAIKRNEKIANEQGVGMKVSMNANDTNNTNDTNSVVVEDFTRKLHEFSTEDRLWRIIFDLIDELKQLKKM